MNDLKVDFCSYEAAKWAVEKWHYSKVMPAGETVKFGAWEEEKFIGAIIFSWGANNNIGNPYGLKQPEVCELVRVALREHKVSVTQVVSLTINMLKAQSPGLRLIVSYADCTNQGHLGVIYQAGNWIYEGKIKPLMEGSWYIINGKLTHGRTVRSRWGSEKNIPSRIKWEYAPDQWKHKYLYPLDRAMRRQIAPLAKPYPKRESMRPTNGSTSPPSEGWQFDSDQAALALTGHKTLPVPLGETPRRVSGDPLGRL